MNRVYYPYTEWEDFKAGFYSDYSKSELNDFNASVRFVFSSVEKTELWMTSVITHWVKSSEHNLTNISMNRVAWLGQAACCYYGGVPCKATMFLWKFLDEKIQRRSDKVAQKIIKEWEQKRKLQATLISGSKGVTKEEFQMKLPLNWSGWESFQVIE
jgi:hypothetical protein